jgi:double-stranded uracil-DNA glycosylase
MDSYVSGMVLPDVLCPGLRVVFCGTAVGAISSKRGAYYAGPGNKFWRTLHETGLTPLQLSPSEFGSVLEHGIGLTDLCKTLSGSDVEVGRGAFDVEALVQAVRANTPHVVAFNGVKAGREALGSIVGYGRQPRDFAGVEAWVLPSTSGAANRWWDAAWWHELASRVHYETE